MWLNEAPDEDEDDEDGSVDMVGDENEGKTSGKEPARGRRRSSST